MMATDWLALLVAIGLGVLAGTRTSAALAGRNRPLWIAHILIVVSLFLAVTPTYSAVDGLLGETNLTNLISHLLFGLVFFFGCQHVAFGAGRPDLAVRISGTRSLLILAVLSTLITATFFLADLKSSSMGLNAFSGDGFVAAYKSLSFAFPMLCSLVLIKPLYREATAHFSHGAQRMAMWCLCIGFSLVVPVPFMHVAEFWLPALKGWEDLFLYSAILLVALGPLIAFLELRRHTSAKRIARAK